MSVCDIETSVVCESKMHEEVVIESLNVQKLKREIKAAGANRRPRP